MLTMPLKSAHNQFIHDAKSLLRSAAPVLYLWAQRIFSVE